MSVFTQLFFSVFNYYKKKNNKNANTIAVRYISFLEVAAAFVLGSFFAVFLKQMKVTSITNTSFLVLFVIVAVIITFKNYMKYGGRSRKALNAKQLKQKPLNYSISLLWVLPIACFALGFILLQQL